MNPGAYRERVEIQKCINTTDRFCNHKQEWETHYIGHAYVNMLSGAEYWAAAAVRAESTLQFVLRWHPLLNNIASDKYRLLWRGKAYNITSIDNVQFANKTVKIRGVAK